MTGELDMLQLADQARDLYVRIQVEYVSNQQERYKRAANRAYNRATRRLMMAVVEKFLKVAAVIGCSRTLH